MTSPANMDADSRIFLLNSLELAAAVFRGPGADGWIAIVETGLPELVPSAPPGSAPLREAVVAFAKTLPSPLDPDRLTFLETEYVRLFVAAGGGVTAPLYQSCYGEKARVMGNSARRMQQLLNTAGLEVALDSNEPPDHLSIQLEYLYHLLATSWSGRQPEHETEAKAFAQDVMLPWVRLFAKALQKDSRDGVYTSAAALVVAILLSISD